MQNFTQYGDLATWVAAIAAILSIGFGLFERRASEQKNKANQSLAQQNSKLQERQHRLEVRAWADSHFEATRSWANQVCFAISEALHLPSGKEGIAKRQLILATLSTLIDTGRWYFPNSWADEYGAKKEPAYRGVRQPVLNCVVDAYRQLNDGIVNRDDLVSCKRMFVSYIQEFLDPRERDEEIRRLLFEFGEAKRLRDAPGA